MKLQLISDAHLNCGTTFSVVNPEADVLVLAGDMASSPKAAKEYLRSVRKQTKAPIVYVLGNHEYYGRNLYTAVDDYKKAVSKIKDVYLLEKECVEIRGVNFLGTTLWSDVGDPIAGLAVQQALADYTMIEREPEKYVRPIDTHTEYILAVKWLTNELEARAKQTNVVVTHHAPCWECRNTYFDYERNNRMVTQGFCSRLNTLIFKNDIDYWLYGHTHRSHSFRIKATRIVSNQVGYEHERKHSGFDRRQILEI